MEKLWGEGVFCLFVELLWVMYVFDYMLCGLGG